MKTKEKLTEIIGNVVVNDKGNRIRDVFHPEFVEKIVDALIVSGAIVPPCKVGQTLYDITEFLEECNCPQIYEYKDNAMYIEKVGKDRFLFTYDGMCIHPEGIGKTVFLTREEAEKALKGGEG